MRRFTCVRFALAFKCNHSTGRSLKCVTSDFAPMSSARTRSIPRITSSRTADAYVAEGFSHLIVSTSGPEYDLEPVRRLVEWRNRRRSETGIA
jgi:hypothetical protein